MPPQSFTRVRDTMMAKLQEAANQPVTAPAAAEGPVARRDGINDTGNKDGSDSKRNGRPDAASVADAGGVIDEGENEAIAAPPPTGAFVGRTSGNPGTDVDEPRGAAESSAFVPADESGREQGKGAPGEDDWAEEIVDHPPPDYGMGSPVIR